jgi:hypothetical protein
MGGRILSQEEKNLVEGSGHSINIDIRNTSRILLDDSNKYAEGFLRFCGKNDPSMSQKLILTEVLNSKLPHLASEIQTQPMWLKVNLSPEWLKLCILHSPTGPDGLLQDSWWTPDRVTLS